LSGVIKWSPPEDSIHIHWIIEQKQIDRWCATFLTPWDTEEIIPVILCQKQCLKLIDHC